MHAIIPHAFVVCAKEPFLTLAVHDCGSMQLITVVVYRIPGYPRDDGKHGGATRQECQGNEANQGRRQGRQDCEKREGSCTSEAAACATHYVIMRLNLFIVPHASSIAHRKGGCAHEAMRGGSRASCIIGASIGNRAGMRHASQA